jgi:acetate kinase
VGRILVVNAGSTSLKLSLVAEDEASEPVGSLADVDPGALDGVAHRVVHGGPAFRDPVVIDDDVRDAVRGLEEVAPLHNAPAIRGIDEATEALGTVPQVAVFDTAYHASIPAEAATYAVPPRWREEWGIRRYGFHGLSVAWAAERVPASRLVVCHLGGGCSVTAVRDGRSVDTTMGFTPLEGVPMATRSGSVDPGALLHLLNAGKLDADGLDRALNHESGLLGLGGTTHVRELGPRAAAGDEEAALALGVFSHRVAQAVAAMAVAAGGLDALVFTAGIGEGSALVRRLVCERLAFLGVELDDALNDSAEPDAVVSLPGSPVRVAVVRAREDVVAARAARRVLSRGA